MTNKKTALVIGTGAGGAMAAKELQKQYQVTMLEAGGNFHPFAMPLKPFEKARGTGLFFDERLIRTLVPNMAIDKLDDMVLVTGRGIGGTTTLATGNAVRYDRDLKEIGIDLDAEFDELYEELPITTDHQKRWTGTTKKMYALFEEMGLDPIVTPKLLYAEKCTGCGHCAIGCTYGAKWDTRELVKEAVEAGARLITNCRVKRMIVQSGSVTAVEAVRNLKTELYTADVIVLAAGGIGTSQILEASGIQTQKTLFVDPVLCIAGPMEGLHQERQILMPFISQQDGYILSPYMDYLSFFFNKKWHYPIEGIASMMIKLADEEKGSVGVKKIDKRMSEKDTENMAKAEIICAEILDRLGVPYEKQFKGTLNAGHPGGTLPLSEQEKDTMHHPSLPQNVYIADATLIPKAMGNPPILTIMALAKRVAAVIGQNI